MNRRYKVPAYKDHERGTWYVSFYYEDWTGIKKRKVKRGFRTRKEAIEWERMTLLQKTSDLDMTFAAFIEVYTEDLRNRIKENTWQMKENVIRTKLIPYFGNKKMNQIRSKDVIAWQNEMMQYRGKDGEGYSPVYLKTMHNQLSAILNHAVRHYGLKANPAAQAGNMGKERGKEMLFWTKEEYLKFVEQAMEQPLMYYAFEMLYWCGLRMGELLALTPADFNFERKTVSVSKSYQRIKGRDVITDPKTEKSNRIVQMPQFLCEEMQECIQSIYDVKPSERIFPLTKSQLHRDMEKFSEAAGVKRIRIHDLRHSHVSLLIDMGFSALAIAERVGHESIDITYRYAHLFPTKQQEMALKMDEERTRKTNY